MRRPYNSSRSTPAPAPVSVSPFNRYNRRPDWSSTSTRRCTTNGPPAVRARTICPMRGRPRKGAMTATSPSRSAGCMLTPRTGIRPRPAGGLALLDGRQDAVDRAAVGEELQAPDRHSLGETGEKLDSEFQARLIPHGGKGAHHHLGHGARGFQLLHTVARRLLE